MRNDCIFRKTNLILLVSCVLPFVPTLLHCSPSSDCTIAWGMGRRPPLLSSTRVREEDIMVHHYIAGTQVHAPRSRLGRREWLGSSGSCCSTLNQHVMFPRPTFCSPCFGNINFWTISMVIRKLVT